MAKQNERNCRSVKAISERSRVALFLVQPTRAVFLYSNSGGEENEEAEKVHTDKVHGKRLKV